MPKTHAPYAPEFRQQMIELVRTGRTPGELEREFEVCAQTIRNWIRQAERDEGHRSDGVSSVDREELRMLRRENRRLRQEREILAKAAALVRPSGVMVVATIDRTLLSYLFAIIGAEYLLGWLPRGTHRWRQFVESSELEGMLHNDGFTVVARSGVKVNPLNRRFSLSRLQAVNYMVVATKGVASGA